MATPFRKARPVPGRKGAGALAPGLLAKGAAAANANGGAAPGVRDIKKRCVQQTLYLLPMSDTRVKVKAAVSGVSVHEFLLDCLDARFAADGEGPLERYSPPRPRKR